MIVNKFGGVGTRHKLSGNWKLNPMRNYYVRHTNKYVEHTIPNFRKWKVHRDIVHNSFPAGKALSTKVNRKYIARRQEGYYA